MTDEIASVLREEIAQYKSGIDVREVGRVLEVGDGIARVWGLSGVMAGEMVEFPHGITGLAFNLEENSVGVIILGDYLKVTEGDEVKSTGRLLSVPATRSSAASSTRSATRSTAKGRWSPICAGRWRRSPPAWLSGHRSASRCRRASRRSTP
jgi:hypothetical protein